MSEPKVLFDPQQSPSNENQNQLVSLLQDEPFTPRAPRRQVQIVVVPETGQIILIGDPADIEALLPILEEIAKEVKKADTEIRIFTLDHADAVSVLNYLNRIYSRIVLTGSGAARLPPGQALGQASVVMFALPRQNAILVAGPKNRMKDIEDIIRTLDLPMAGDGKVRIYSLKRASAARVATVLQNLYSQRFFPEESPPQQNLIRIQPDDRSNSVLVQASPTDQEEIARVINHLDVNASEVVNELRIVKLKNAVATSLALILQSAISETLGGAVGQQPGQQPGQPGVVPAPPTVPPGTPGAVGQQIKALSFRFIAQREEKAFESGFLEDVRITPDLRTNTLLISAPPKSMDLLLALIKELDIPPAAQAEVKVFTFKNADATQMGIILQQLFLSQQTGAAGQVPGAVGQLPTFTTGEDAPLVQIRLAVDTRTNSLIVAGQRGDLLLAEALINKLEGTLGAERKNEVYRLKNSTANDVANAVNQFITNQINLLISSGNLTAITQLERQVIVVPEPISNMLIISATPAYFEEVMRLVKRLDELPPQVAIQVLIAEVRLDGTEEFGVEFGLQSKIVFERNLSGGVTVNEPGFNFLPGSNLPNNSLGANPGAFAPQALSTFNMGRSGAVGFGGFVLNATSDTVNLLIRALQAQGKVEILSRPQITTLDNQNAVIQVGQEVPIITGTSVTTGVVQNTVERVPVGIILQVTPKINPELDGHVIMRVQPEVSSVSDSSVPLGGGAVAPIINRTIASTTVSAYDGQTVVIGGLITRQDSKTERKVPWLGDLAYVGAAFRFRSQTKRRSELLIILTPRIIRNRAEALQFLTEESGKINWNLRNVTEVHGALGTESILPGGNGYHPGCIGLPGGPPPLIAPPKEELLPNPPTPLPPTPPPPGPETIQPPAELPSQVNQPTVHHMADYVPAGKEPTRTFLRPLGNRPGQ